MTDQKQPAIKDIAITPPIAIDRKRPSSEAASMNQLSLLVNSIRTNHQNSLHEEIRNTHTAFCGESIHGANYAASRNFSDGLSIVTIVFGGTLRLSVTLEPTNEPAPTIVVPPRMDALL